MDAAQVLRQFAHDLEERVKELNCLYAISRLTLTPGISLEAIFQGTVDLIPAAWQYPAITCARISFEGRDYVTANYRPCRRAQRREMAIDGRDLGLVEVGYLEERPESEEGPFLFAERSLIDAIAERLVAAVQHKRAEEALQASEARYRAVVEQSRDGIVLVDWRGTVVEWNAGQARICGLSAGDAIGRPGWEVLARLLATDDDPAPERLRRALLGALARRHAPWLNRPTEMDLRRPDGERRSVQTLFFPVLRGGEFMIGSITRDVTDYRRVEAELRRSQEQVRLFSDNIRGSVIYRYRLQPDGGFDYVSPSALAVTGYTAEELSADPDLYFDGVHEEDRLLAEAALRSPTGLRGPISLRWRRKDGGIIWLEQRQVPARGDNGEVIAVEGVMSDVTDLRRAEEGLRESERRQEILLQSSPIAVFRRQAREGFATVWANEKARSVTGFAAARFVNDPGFWVSRLHPDDRAGALAQYRRARATGSATFEYRWRCADDSYHRLLDRAVLSDEELVVTTLDISNRRRAQAGAEVAAVRPSLGHSASNWLDVTVLLPATQAATTRRPAACPHCGSAVLSRHQVTARRLKGKPGRVEVVRYLCRDCGRTFSHHPPGVDRGRDSAEVRALMATLYGLGLSAGKIESLVSRTGAPVSRTSAWRIGKQEGEAMRRSRPPAVSCLLPHEDSPATNEFLVIEAVEVSATGAAIKLLIWERQDRIITWLRRHLAAQGAELQVQAR